MRYPFSDRKTLMAYRTQVGGREEDDPRLRLDALSGPVGKGGKNDRLDVAKVEALLGAHGYLDLEATGGPTGFAGTRLDDATRRFQRDKGLKIDGRLAPRGETIMTLAMSKAPEKPKGKLPEYDPEGRLPGGGRVTIGDPVTGEQRPPTRDEFTEFRDVLAEEPRGIIERALQAIAEFVEKMRDRKPTTIDGPTGGGIRDGRDRYR